MTEPQILDGLFDALGAVMSIVSLFLGLVSGYLAALYFVLGRATFAMRLFGFALLSIALAFLGGTMLVVQQMQAGLLQAWGRLKAPTVTTDFRNPLPVSTDTVMSQQELGVAMGWIVAFAVYLALAYMTFGYRWPRRPRDLEA